MKRKELFGQMWTAEWMAILVLIVLTVASWTANGIKLMMGRIRGEESLVARMRRIEDVHVQIPSPVCREMMAALDERIAGIGNGRGIGMISGKVETMEKNIATQIEGLRETFETGMQGVTASVKSLDSRVQTIEKVLMLPRKEGS